MSRIITQSITVVLIYSNCQSWVSSPYNDGVKLYRQQATLTQAAPQSSATRDSAKAECDQIIKKAEQQIDEEKAAPFPGLAALIKKKISEYKPTHGGVR